MTVSIAVIAVSVVRILEALFSERLQIFAGGSLTEGLESIGMYGRFSVETALFFIFCFGFELSRRTMRGVTVLMMAGTVGILSFGLVEVVFGYFLWGNELSFITQIAMLLVAADLVYRMRREVPFRGLFRARRISLFFQVAAVAVYVLPMIVGVWYVRNWELSPDNKAPFEFVFAGASWALLCLTLMASAFFSRTMSTIDREGFEHRGEENSRRFEQS
ncbi:hypothetical protein FMN50_11150 [Rhodobacterales bacterium]|nr:hypothetical protein FMN50_11150 [Rhodobacterales bacterium]